MIAAFPICVTDDAAAASVFATEALGMYGAQPSYRAMLDREGLAGAGDVAIVGDEASVTARIEELAEIGVDELGAYVLAPNPEDAARTRALLGTRLRLIADRATGRRVCRRASARSAAPTSLDRRPGAGRAPATSAHGSGRPASRSAQAGVQRADLASLRATPPVTLARWR